MTQNARTTQEGGPTSRAGTPSHPRVVGPPDRTLFLVLLAMMSWGVVMVYSGSIPKATAEMHNGEYFLVRQAGFAVGGAFVMGVLARVDYHYLGRWSRVFVVLGAVALVGLLVGFGHTVNKATRWYTVGGFSIQPVELVKVALLIWLAQSLANKTGRLGEFWIGFFPHVLVAALLAGLCVFQPDFGSTVFLMLEAFILLACAGVKRKPLLVAVAATLPLGAALIIHKPYRLQRVLAWLRYWFFHGDMRQLSHQVREAWRAIGAGGTLGLGLGEGRRKFFVPEAHTDFIAAVVAEELGLLGFGLLAAGFVWIVQRGVRAAHSAVDELGFMLGMGTSLFLGVQAATNLAVVLHVFPTKGLALPFFTYGGSSLLANAVAMGVLLNVTRPREVVCEDAAVTKSASERGSSVL